MARCAGCSGTGAVSSVDGQTGAVDLSETYVPAAMPFTTTTMPNPVSAGDMTVMILPDGSPALAIARAGDAYPQFLLTWDADETGAVFYFGDGSTDPFNSGNAWIAFDENGIVVQNLKVGQLYPGGSQVVINGGFTSTSNCWIGADNSVGLILKSPNGTSHRITVNDAGTVSSVPYP